MNCRKVQNLISAYVDSELPGVEMLALRHHLSTCSECSSEYEALLSMKRAFGGLSAKLPSPVLAERILLHLDRVSQTPQEHFLVSLRKHLTVFPGKLRFAAATMGVFAVLLTLRSGQIYNNSMFLAPPQGAQIATLGSTDSPDELFPAASHVGYGRLITRPSPAPDESLMPSSGSFRMATATEGSAVPAGYSVLR